VNYLIPWSSIFPAQPLAYASKVIGLLADHLRGGQDELPETVTADGGLIFCDTSPCSSDSDLEDILENSSNYRQSAVKAEPGTVKAELVRAKSEGWMWPIKIVPFEI